MLLKVVFNKTAFVKFKIINNFKQNIHKTHSNNQKSIEISLPADGFHKSQEKNPRIISIKTFALCLLSQKKPTLGYVLKNL